MSITKIAKLSSYYHTLALTEDGNVWTWGSNQYGECGTGTQSTPSKLTKLELSGVKDISTASNRSVAVKDDGTVWVWGEYMTLDEKGYRQSSFSPIQRPELENVVAAAMGAYFSLYLKADGTVWSIGEYNSTYGALSQIPGLSDIIAVACNQRFSGHGLALKRDGTVWAWGNNESGQLGDGTKTDRSFPVQVLGLTDVTAISVGGNFCFALKRDGSVWGWGANWCGQLGTGKEMQDSSIPVEITALKNIVKISSNSAQTTALDKDGAVWWWGGEYRMNFNMEFYPGVPETIYIPEKLEGVSCATDIASGAFHNFFVTKEGNIHGWGFNESGQINPENYFVSPPPRFQQMF